MPTKKDKDETVAGYSGDPAEGQPPVKRPKEASKDAVVSPAGVTEPTKELSGEDAKILKE